MLFEVAILEQPTPKAAEEGKLERLVFRTEIVAADDKAASNKVLMNGSQKLAGIDPDRMIVLVRPFV